MLIMNLLYHVEKKTTTAVVSTIIESKRLTIDLYIGCYLQPQHFLGDMVGGLHQAHQYQQVEYDLAQIAPHLRHHGCVAIHHRRTAGGKG